MENQFLQNKKILKIRIIFSTVLFFLFLLIFIFSIIHFEKKKNISSTKKELQKISDILNKNLNRFENVTKIISQEPVIKNINKKFRKEEIDSIIDTVKKLLDASIVYIMDSSGTVVASTEYKKDKTLLGNNYKFRPYFINSMQGEHYVYFALGVTTNERGVYFSYPIKQNSKVIGVTVIKKNIDEFDNIFKNNPNTISGLVSIEGIIFACSNDDWLYKTISPISEKKLKNIYKSKKYANKKIKLLNYNLTSSVKPKINGIRYIFIKKNIDIPKWKIFLLRPIYYGDYINKIILAFIILTLILIIFISFFTHLYRKKNNLISKALYEQELKDAKEFSELIIKLSPNAIFTVDFDKNITSWNNMAEQITGYSSEEIINKKCHIFANKPCADGCGLFSKDIPKPITNSECQIKCKDGTFKSISKNADLLFDSQGKIIGGIETFQDITELKEIQKQLIHSEKLAALGELTSGIAHEFNNMLGVIKLNTDILLTRVEKNKNYMLTEKDIGKLISINKIIKRAKNIILNMKSFSKPIINKKQKADICLLIDRIIDFQYTHIQKEKIKIIKRYNTDKEIKIDEGQLEQVFMNLIINARHAILPKGEGTITIEVNEIFEKGITIILSDSGIGIDSDKLDKIFTPFFTTKGGKAKDAFGIEGTGLGLSVSFKIIEEHNGTIKVNSTPGKGTTFTIYIPFT